MFWRSLAASAAHRSANDVVLPAPGDGFELHEHVVEEEGEPDALALAVLADEVHAVVPVAAAHERQAVLAEAQAVLDGADAVLVERGRTRRTRAGRS